MFGKFLFVLLWILGGLINCIIWLYLRLFKIFINFLIIWEFLFLISDNRFLIFLE